MKINQDEKRALGELVTAHITHGVNSFQGIRTGHELGIYAKKEGLAHWTMMLELQKKLYQSGDQDHDEDH